MKKTLFIAITVLVIAGLIVGVYFLVDGSNESKKKRNLEETEIVFGKDVSIEGYGATSKDGVVTINKSGTYNLTGIYNGKVVVDAEGRDVVLNLDDTIIESSKDAAINCINANSLVINLKEGTINKLSDGGSSKYNAALYSNAPLIIDGKGSLSIIGNNEEGIATANAPITINSGTINIEAKDDGINAGDDGDTITINNGIINITADGDGIDSNKDIIMNDGTVFVTSTTSDHDAVDYKTTFEIKAGLLIALGNGKINAPSKESTQKSISFEFDSKLESDKVVSLLNKKDNVIISFLPNVTFKTLTVSSPLLTATDYKLYNAGENSGRLTNGVYSGGIYTKGKAVSINSKSTFTIKDGVVNTKIS